MLNFLNNTPIAEWASPKDHMDIILADDGSAAATGVQTPRAAVVDVGGGKDDELVNCAMQPMYVDPLGKKVGTVSTKEMTSTGGAANKNNKGTRRTYKKKVRPAGRDEGLVNTLPGESRKMGLEEQVE